MPNPFTYHDTLAHLYRNYSEDVGKALIRLGVIGWILSALAQIVMIAKNDKIQKKDKKFLIPQEIADGAINVGLFYGVCKTLKSYGDKLCERGKIILGSTDDIIHKIKNDNQTVQAAIDGINKNLLYKKTIDKSESKRPLSAIYSALIKDFDNIKHKKKNNINAKGSYFFKSNPIIKTKADKTALLEAVKKAQSEFKANKNGIGVIATIAGSILACNLITPVCRNLVANGFQTKYINKCKPKPVFVFATTKTFNAFKL